MEKHIDWKRLSWTIGILTAIVLITYLNMIFITKDWQSSVYDSWNLIMTPSPLVWKILGGLFYLIIEIAGLIGAIISLIVFGYGIKGLIHFFYHNGEVKKDDNTG